MVNRTGTTGQIPIYARAEVTRKMRDDARKWVELAACRGVDPNIFDVPDFYDEAAEYCGRCPVRDECLDLILSHSDFEGIAGGMAIKKRGGRLFFMRNILTGKVMRQSRKEPPEA
jgi:hypothetical protein